MITIGLIIGFILTIVANSFYDRHQIVIKNKPIDHKLHLLVFILVICIITLCTYAFALPELNEVLAALILVPSLRFNIHDGILIKSRGLHWSYIDLVDPALTDKFLGFMLKEFDMKPWYMRIILLFISIIFSTLIYKLA